jgi:hypothetical protein
MMDNRLKGLKESMDDTVLKDIDFRMNHKAEVRKAINTTKTPSRSSIFIPRLLTVCFTMMFAVSIGYFGIEQLSEKEGLVPPGMGDTDKLKPVEQEKEETVPTPAVQAESYEEMSKEDVLHKLLNTVDYFENASGQFETFSIYYDESTSKGISEYSISNKDVIGGYEKYTNIPDEKIPGGTVQIHETYYNDQTVWSLDHRDMLYYTMDFETVGTPEIVLPEDVFSISLNKLYDSLDRFRERPPGTSAHASLFPYEDVAKYLRFTDLWQIEKQNEELLGHNTIVLAGTLDESIDERMQPQAESFRFWVDKDTGILMKKEVYDKNGEIVGYLHPESLLVNTLVNLERFTPNLEGFSERVVEPFYKDPREKDIEVVEHADTVIEEVEEVAKGLRTEIPFLYEFSQPDLQFFSASMEKYQDFKQGYFVYSYKKNPNDMGSGSRLLYVRMYHKDAIVRSFTDFDTEKGKEFGSFTLNGVDWKAYEIKNTPNTHFIGHSGEYVYEVVTQEISFEESKRLLESFKKSTP